MTQPKLKPLIKSLREGKIVRFRTENGDWLVHYENTFPFLYETHGYICLLHRHGTTGVFHQQCESAWCTPIGLSELLTYIKKHDFEYIGALNENIEIDVIEIENVADDLPYDDFVDKIQGYLCDGFLEVNEEVDLKNWVTRTFLECSFLAQNSAVLAQCQDIVDQLVQDEEQEERMLDEG